VIKGHQTMSSGGDLATGLDPVRISEDRELQWLSVNVAMADVGEQHRRPAGVAM
jgi:hypothetical protein